MSKLWLVFRHEYLRHVLRKRFLFALLSLPAFIVLMGGVGLLSAVLVMNNAPLGYVDQSGLLSDPILPEKDNSWLFRDPELIAFPDEASARAAITAGKIQASFILGPDYLETGVVRLIAADSNSSNRTSVFEEFLKRNLLKNQPAATVTRILEGPSVTVLSSDSSRQMTERDIIGIVLPILAGVLFIIAINTSGGYLLQAVVEEKENRTMEIVITSLSPEQLMAGKILGNLSVGLTQLLIWMLFVVLGVTVARTFFPFASELRIDPTSLWLMLATLLPAFVMIAALMAMVGATATEASEAQQIAGLFTLPVVSPYWFFASIMNNPNGPLATGLSLFPLTAPVAMPLRAVFTNVPLWQIAGTVTLLLLVAAAAIWMAGRAFRIGMLRYGKRIAWREIFSRSGGAA